MIELIVVMIVLGVLAALAMPRLTDRRALQERGFRDAVAVMLRHAHQLAQAQRRDVCVLLTPALARSVYVAGGACSPANPVAEPGGSVPFSLAAPFGVTLGGAARVRFNSSGQPVPNANQIVSVGTQVLTVSRETGIVF